MAAKQPSVQILLKLSLLVEISAAEMERRVKGIHSGIAAQHMAIIALQTIIVWL